jgi:tryptophan-rich sensory protein
MKKYISLIAVILAFEIISGGIGHLNMESVREWYSTLERPSFAPPNWVFPVVWTTLYAMIAGAGWVIWRMPPSSDRKQLLGLFTAYMLMSWGWSFVFFTAQSLLGGFIWIVVYDLIALVLVIKAWKAQRTVAWLMLPSLFWTLFAAALNFAYWQLNS